MEDFILTENPVNLEKCRAYLEKNAYFEKVNFDGKVGKDLIAVLEVLHLQGHDKKSLNLLLSGLRNSLNSY